MDKYKIAVIVNIFILIISILLSLQIKMQINQLNHGIYKIKKQIADERATIQILEAEWSYLIRPSRLSVLAKKYLKTYRVPNKINDSSFLKLLNNK